MSSVKTNKNKGDPPELENQAQAVCTMDDQLVLLKAFERLCKMFRNPDVNIGEEKGPVFEEAKNKLFNYLDDKFSEQKAVRLLRRFFIEATGIFAAWTPGNQCSTEEHHNYSLNHLIEAISLYTPHYQRELLAEYLTDILPEKDANYDQAEDEAIFDVLFGSVERGQYIRDCIQSLHQIPTEELEEIKWHLQAKEC